MPHPRQLNFPLNKAEYISALYSTLAAIGHQAAVEGQLEAMSRWWQIQRPAIDA